MSTSTFRSFAIVISILGGLVVGSARIAVAQVPGDPLAGGPFVMTFDENGRANINGQPVPFQPVAGGGVDYLLPVPVVPGSVNVFGPASDGSPNNPNGFSDLMIFSSSPTSGTGILRYQSLLDDDTSLPDLADVRALLPADTGLSVTETGPEGANDFLWVTTSGTQYHGISDVPEPSAIILGGLGLASLVVLACRRGRHGPAR